MSPLTTIDSNLIKQQVNKCYLEYDPNYPACYGDPTLMNGFKYYLERTAGLRLEFEPEMKNGRMGFGMKRAEILDDKKFMMFRIKYS